MAVWYCLYYSVVALRSISGIWRKRARTGFTLAPDTISDVNKLFLTSVDLLLVECICQRVRIPLFTERQ